MFTGLIAAVGKLESGSSTPAGTRLRLASPWDDLEVGESIAVDGVCLTVATRGTDGRFEADASSETIARSTLGRMNGGERVHLERALRPSDRMGGHFVTGHVDAVGTVASAEGAGGGTLRLAVRLPDELMPQVAPKGSIALDGVSLTVNEVRGAELTVMVVPHTARATKLGDARAGQAINVETDVLAKYVARLAGGGTEGGVTADLLERCGFGKP